MTKAIRVDADPDGEIWIESVAPIEVLSEKGAPFRIAIRARVGGQRDSAPAVWLRTERAEVPRLIENLNRALEEGRQSGAASFIRSVKVRAPSNGGINSESGDLCLAFHTTSGTELRLEVPYPQSGPLVEILSRAVRDAATWYEEHNPDKVGATHGLDCTVLDAEQVQIGEEIGARRPLLTVRVAGGAQFTFLLDKQMTEQLRSRRVRPTESEERRRQPDLYSPVADEIEWLRDEWCVMFAPPSDSDLRRGSAALRLLLIYDGILMAWRHHGFEGQPMVYAPDVEALAREQGFELRHASAVFGGGGRVDGIESSMVAIVKAYNPETGRGPDDDSGFAVKTTIVARDARGEYTTGPLHDFVRRPWKLKEYLRSVSLVRRGTSISRDEVVKYFANFAGGAHLDALGKGGTEKAQKRNELIAELKGNGFITSPRLYIDGLHFELLSIGQALGSSSDLLRLAARIRKAETPEELAAGPGEKKTEV